MRGESIVLRVPGYEDEVRSKTPSYIRTCWLIHVDELKGRVDNAEANKGAVLDKRL